MKVLLAALLFLLPAASIVTLSPARADSPPFLDPLFTDNMVLQRGIHDNVWGWTDAGQTVTVTIDGKSAKATAGPDGKWVAKLPVFKAGGPYTLTVSGPQSATVNNVLVGDVWVCSGQSNMQFGIGNIDNADQEIASADYPMIRLLTIPNKISESPETLTSGTWEVCNPDNLRKDGNWNGFSAVSYFFGKELYKDLGIPIGLIHTSWGGTPAQAWVSEAALGANMPDYKDQIAALDADRVDTSGKTFAQKMDDWYAANDPGSTSAAPWSAATFDDSAWKTMTLPGAWEQAGDPDLANFDGTVWFRKQFDLPAAAAGKDLTLHFFAVHYDAAWVNGVEVGSTIGQGRGRDYTVPAAVLKTGKNEIAIRVLNLWGPGGIVGMPDRFVIDVPGGDNIALSGSWSYHIGVNRWVKATPVPDDIRNDPNFPVVLYNGMINPLVDYGIKGAIWYQGESNAGQGYQYRTLLPTMITDWRDHWGEGDFPFLIVQLAGYQGPPHLGDDGWAELREAQWLTAQNLKNTGIATAIDIGNPTDVHPHNKAEVGRRLALVARKMVYDEKVVASGPVYKSMKVEGGSIRITFDHCDGGLLTQDSKPLAGFEIAGADQKWVWATGKVDGPDTVVITAQMPSPPVAVRYGWSSYTDANLYNGHGLPAMPFRTDDWKLPSQPAK